MRFCFRTSIQDLVDPSLLHLLEERRPKLQLLKPVVHHRNRDPRSPPLLDIDAAAEVVAMAVREEDALDRAALLLEHSREVLDEDGVVLHGARPATGRVDEDALRSDRRRA